jgi:hypothetical protein
MDELARRTLMSKWSRSSAAKWTLAWSAVAIGVPMQARAADAPAAMRSASEWMNEAYRLKRDGKGHDAVLAFESARAAGADPQRVDLELAYLALDAGDYEGARRHLGDAQAGPDAALRAQASRQARLLPSHFGGDMYVEAFAFDRLAPTGSPTAPNVPPDLVPTVRLRGYYRPWLSLDAALYVFAQATRDTSSHGIQLHSSAELYADDALIVGAGIRGRYLDGRAAWFAQIGPSFDLLHDGRPRTQLDARLGTQVSLATQGCFPKPAASGSPVRFELDGCAEVYGEAVYVSRYDNDVIGFVRPRAGATALVTGPLAWQPLVEARAALDANKDYWNNFADAGAALRVRLLEPFVVDAVFGIHTGTYFGFENKDPAPKPLAYTDARLLVSTFVNF